MFQGGAPDRSQEFRRNPRNSKRDDFFLSTLHTSSMATTPVSNEREPAQFAKPAEAALFLGLSKSMVLKQVGQGQIPARRYGRAVRIPWEWLLAQTGRN
jgi:excisionase family DNA binding protein